MKLSVNRLLPLAVPLLFSGCVAAGSEKPVASAPLPTTGPAADYPVVIGEPFTIGSKVYEPVDTLNYDAVGYGTVSTDSVQKITIAHKTLPLPSYAEVTALDSGRTILARVETRGPMVTNRIIELSEGAASQLGVVGRPSIPVRIRRVNPPEQERHMLRQGGKAPLRIDTPDALLKVLNRKLDKQEPLAAPGAVPNPPPPAIVSQDPDLGAAVPTPPKIATPPKPATPAPVTQPVKPAKPAKTAPPAKSGDLVVQAAAFSSQERAEKAAESLGGFVTKPGKYWYLQLGPFETRAQAAPALEKARIAGYSDARIQRAK